MINTAHCHKLVIPFVPGSNMSWSCCCSHDTPVLGSGRGFLIDGVPYTKVCFTTLNPICTVLFCSSQRKRHNRGRETWSERVKNKEEGKCQVVWTFFSAKSVWEIHLPPWEDKKSTLAVLHKNTHTHAPTHTTKTHILSNPLKRFPLSCLFFCFFFSFLTLCNGTSHCIYNIWPFLTSSIFSKHKIISYSLSHTLFFHFSLCWDHYLPPGHILSISIPLLVYLAGSSHQWHSHSCTELNKGLTQLLRFPFFSKSVTLLSGLWWSFVVHNLGLYMWHCMEQCETSDLWETKKKKPKKEPCLPSY